MQKVRTAMTYQHLTENPDEFMAQLAAAFCKIQDAIAAIVEEMSDIFVSVATGILTFYSRRYRRALIRKRQVLTYEFLCHFFPYRKASRIADALPLWLLLPAKLDKVDWMVVLFARTV
jgi:hypothetical protein